MVLRKVNLILLILGLIFLLYPLLSDVIFSINHSTVISNYNSQVLESSNEELNHNKENIDKYNKELVDSEKGQVKIANEDDEKEEISYLNLLDLGETIGYIEIPKIEINLPIYHGVSDSILQSGIGHMENTSIPNGKNGTHCVLAGHSGLMQARLFDDIDKLEIGDLFLISVLDEKYAYKIDQVKVVLPEETSDIEIIDEKEYVTLVTCVPYGVNSHRLLVRGTGIEESSVLDEKIESIEVNEGNTEIQREIEKITESDVATEISAIIEKIRIVLIIIVIIAIILVKIYCDAYDRKIKRKIKAVKEREKYEI